MDKADNQAPELGIKSARHGTAIGWTHWPGTRGETLVTVTGCDPASRGCDNCYSAALSSGPRLARLEKYRGVAVTGKFTGLVKLHPGELDKALHWQDRRTIFYNSMSDWLHPRVPDGFVADGYAVAAYTVRHNWLKLTKRHARLRALLRSAAFRDLVLVNYRRRFGASAPLFDWPLPNVAVGVSVEDQNAADLRMPCLVDAADHAECLFVSAEPLLDEVDLTRWLPIRKPGQLWVIAGGESGPHHRPLNLDHARGIRDQCAGNGVAFFFKQVGGPRPTSGGKELDEREHQEFPAMAYRTVPA